MKLIVTENQYRFLRKRLNENQLINNLNVDTTKKSTDLSSKADYVDADVKDFYDILYSIKEPVRQQAKGNVSYQQVVEAVQIGLMILGYDLPKYGVDGLFGSETASAVRKYKIDNNIREDISQELSENLVTIGDMNFSRVTVDDDSSRDKVNKALLDDLEIAAKNADIYITVTTISSGHSDYTKSGNKSRHSYGAAVDVAVINGVGSKDPKFLELGDKLRDELINLGYSNNVESGKKKAVIWRTNIGGNHFNHLHISNVEGIRDLGTDQVKSNGETITPVMVEKMISQLKSKNITKDLLSKYVDPSLKTGGNGFIQIDLSTEEGVKRYAMISDNYIKRRNPNAKVDGNMLARVAKDTFDRYKRYVPVELALAQLTLEGGLSTDPNAIPIKTKNLFNVGNTGTNTKYLDSVETGVRLYYDLIARNYLNNTQNATDLLTNFVNVNGNRYAGDMDYEKKLRELVTSINRSNAV